MKRYNDASYPPLGQWDRRLTDVACHGLQPVEVLHRNEWFVVRNRGGYFTTEFHLAQVIVLPVVADAGIVMVRVRRPLIGDTPLELPAGAIERDEPPVAGAARECAEETGITVPDLARFRPMPPMSTSPNRMPNLVYVFRVDLTRQEFDQRKPHDREVQSVHCIPIEEVMRLAAEGGIYVAAPVAVIASYLFSRAR